MSSAHDGHTPSSPFGGSPFKTFFQKRSTPSPRLCSLLRAFEETLEGRFKSLRPKDSDPSEVLTLSWMRSAVESMCKTHVDVKSLITDLEFPLTDWDEQWMDVYLDNSVKLLDMCIALNSELSHLDQGQLFLQYALHSLDSSDGSMPSSECIQGAQRSLHDWVHQISSRGTKLTNSLTILQDLMTSLRPSLKLKNSAKAKVLMQAMYGVKVQTIFVCGVLTAALSRSEATLSDLQVPEKFLWSQAFHELQAAVNGEIRKSASHRIDGRIALPKEFAAVHASTEELVSITTSGDGPYGDMIELTNGSSLNGMEESEKLSRIVAKKKKAEVLRERVLNLRQSTERLSVGMEKLLKQINEFFQIVLTGRDALLCSLRMPGAMEGNTYK